MKKFFFLVVSWQLRLAYTTSILSYINQGEFLSTTKRIMSGFTPYKDLSMLTMCHVFPPQKIYETLGAIFLDRNSKLKPVRYLELNKLEDFKADLFKVHTDAGYLKEADMVTRTKFYSLNANFHNQLEDVIEKLHDEDSQDKYLQKINLINTLFYNAPANLRVAEKCINNDADYEDPTLVDYNGKSHDSINSFTQQSSYLANKYSLRMLKDDSGYVETTDKKKSYRKPKLTGNSHLQQMDVFQFYRKPDRNNERSRLIN